MNVTEREKERYEKIWEQRSYRSKSAYPFAMLINKWMHPDSSCLDIGCGDGITVQTLNLLGRKCEGVDITLAGLPDKERQELEGIQYWEAPAWEMPFKDKQFDYTISTDVLEHIPMSMIDKALKEIDRITRFQSIHQIATFRMGDEHQIVRDIDWWKDKINSVITPTDNDWKIMERK